jgi:hypothetical protein
MISFNNLTNLGRLGNQMFQFASLKGIAKNRGFDFCIPHPNVSGQIDLNVRHSDANIHNTFELKNVRYSMKDYPTITESTFNFDENLFNNCPDNTNLLGYFQNERYFEGIEDEIREEFTFSDEILNSCKELVGDREYISLHIRRGDYLSNPNHPLLSLSYYEEALTHFDTNLPVMVFSDDYKWCQDQKLFGDDRFLISENNTTAIDLCLQSLCTYHIICNSSFSWWGSYLAKSKRTVAPKVWFGSSMLGKDYSGIYRPNWIVINANE